MGDSEAVAPTLRGSERAYDKEEHGGGAGAGAAVGGGLGLRGSREGDGAVAEDAEVEGEGEQGGEEEARAVPDKPKGVMDMVPERHR